MIVWCTAVPGHRMMRSNFIVLIEGDSENSLKHLSLRLQSSWPQVAQELEGRRILTWGGSIWLITDSWCNSDQHMYIDVPIAKLQIEVELGTYSLLADISWLPGVSLACIWHSLSLTQWCLLVHDTLWHISAAHSGHSQSQNLQFSSSADFGTKWMEGRSLW